MAESQNDPRAIVDAILDDLGSMVDSSELVAHIKQALYRNQGLEEALEECFRAPGPVQANARQASDFRNAARRLWEHISASYNRDEDERVVQLRDRLLALTQRQADWIRSLDQRGLNPRQLPRQEMQQLGQLSGMLNASLDALERDDSADSAQISAMMQTLDQVTSAMENMIAQVETHIDAAGGAEPDVNSPEAEPESIFVLKIALQDIRPPIWRRIRVPGNYTLFELHMIVQDVMEWEDYHLHAFQIKGVTYMDPEQIDDLEGAEDETVVTLDALGLREKQKFSYTYDFGDDWRHTVTVEKIIPAIDADEDERYSIHCLAGRRACPPEDCGGPWGYSELLELLQRSEEELDDEDIERLEWLGDSFDPEAFDLQEINDILDEY